MSSKPLNYPFSAIFGMNNVKNALLCSIINPRIKSVIIRGGSGAAKTTIARSIGSRISNKRVINVPLNITEEQMLGGLDIENALKTGSIILQPGLISQANGNILYLDDVNLFDRNILNSILESVTSGSIIIERGHISDSYNCDTTIIATMNPDDVDISSHLLDRFDLCAYTDTKNNHNDRKEILQRTTSYFENPTNFIKQYEKEEQELLKKIEKAKKILPFVTITNELSSIISELCYSIGVEGYRGDIAMMNTVLTLAAIDGREEVNKNDIENAAMLCLTHRRTYSRNPPQESDSTKNEENPSQEPDSSENELENNNNNEKPLVENEDDNLNEEKNDVVIPLLDELLFDVGEQFRVIDYLNGIYRPHKLTKSRKGRREVVESDDTTGRYVRYKIPNDSILDIAFDATICAAVPYQNNREKKGLAISIEKQDIRKKIREKQSGCTLLFVVDASGSLGVKKRMVTVKGTILSMLKESYIKRDRIGMIAFRRNSAEMILPPTKSVEYSYKKLEELPTGGKTPLSEALITTESFMTSYSRCHPGERCFIILITDGRANVSITNGINANEEALKIVENISLPGVKWIVVDTSIGNMRFDNAQKLAQKLDANYFRLDDLNADGLVTNLKFITRY